MIVDPAAIAAVMFDAHVAMITTGHSLGGTYATCAFLQILATDAALSSPMLLGGVYTFGALLVAYQSEGLHSMAQLVQQLFNQVQVAR